MIFYKTWQMIFRGIKSQTRRPVFAEDEPIYQDDRIIGFKRKGRMYLRVGDGTVDWGRKQHQHSKVNGNIVITSKQPTYAIQACRGGWQLGRFRILELRQEPIRAISAADAIAEGIEYDDVMHLEQPLLNHFIIARFTHLWDSIYYRTEYCWENNPLVWVVKFELAERAMVHGIRKNS